MKKITRFTAAVALLFGVATAALAQDAKEEFYPNWFVGLHVGGQTTFTNYDATKLITPQYGLHVGRWFAPEFGARIHATGYQQKGGIADGQFAQGKQTYEFKAVTADLDFLFNMSNIIFPNRTSQAWNWLLIAGFGANYSWDYDDFKTRVGANQPSHPYYHEQVCGTKHGTFNGRFGTAIERNFSRCLALSLEIDANAKNDLYNLKTNECVDWQIAAFIGLTYKFGMKKQEAQPAPEPVKEIVQVVEEKKPEPKPVVVEKKKEEPKPVVVKEEPLNETFYYEIRLSDPKPEAVLNKIADWCKKYPGKSVTISGYADKGTGNPRINAKYAAQRADKVAKWLQQKGIPASQIKVESFGDTVQPFADNDRNRCVIVVGK
jgi:outer membrane protein OmpA-like peptidoglycan-associated protein